jgi:ABC-2 type transport system permease protein
MTSIVRPAMGRRLARRAGAYAALAAMVPKTLFVYNWSVWAQLIQNVVSLVVYVYFWRAVYAGTPTIAGIDLQTTLTYILMARIFRPLANIDLIFEFGWRLRDGGFAMLLVRPVDLQLGYYVQGLANLGVALVRQLPVVLLATLVFGLRWPSDPLVWAVFILSALLGRSLFFCVDWILGTLTFYTTETWGLRELFQGLTNFLTGGLVPLDLMPGWLRLMALATPFAQAVYVPVALLSGLAPLADAPRLLVGQLLWLLGLAGVSRLFFGRAIRHVTVQGG